MGLGHHDPHEDDNGNDDRDFIPGGVKPSQTIPCSRVRIPKRVALDGRGVLLTIRDPPKIPNTGQGICRTPCIAQL